MISKSITDFCKDYHLIENYEMAVNDKENMWICHHKNGILLNKSKEELDEMGLYYNRPPEEFIFLTKHDHKSLHNSNLRQETRDKLSAASSGEKNGMYNKTHTEEARKKIGQKSKNRYASEEKRKKLSQAQKNRYKDPEEHKKTSEKTKEGWARRRAILEI